MTEIEMRIRLKEEGLGTMDDVRARHLMGDLIEQQDIGKVIASGQGLGEMDFDIELADTEFGRDRLRQLAKVFGYEQVQFSPEEPESGAGHDGE